VTLERFFFRLIFLSAVPLLGLALFLAASGASRQIEEQTAAASRIAFNLTTTLDTEIGAQLSALEVLARSHAAGRLDIGRFYTNALAFRDRFGGEVVLADLDRQMLVNTRVPLGKPLPRLPVPAGKAAATTALATGQPAAGDVFLGPLAREPLIALAAPARIGDRLTGIVIQTLGTKQLQQRIDRVARPAGVALWLLDSTGVVMAATAADRTGELPDTRRATGRRIESRMSAAPWKVVLTIEPGVYYRDAAGIAVALLLGVGGLGALAIVLVHRAGTRLAGEVADIARLPAARLRRAPSIDEVRDAQGLLDEARAGLAASEAGYRALFEQAPAGIAVATADGRMVEANAAAARLFGHQAGELSGRQLADLVAEQDRERVPAALAKLRQVGSDSGEWEFRHRDGRLLLVEASGHVLSDGRLMFFARDLTLRRRLEMLDHGSQIVLQALADGESLREILTRLLSHVETVLPAAIGSILLLDDEGQRVRTAVAPGLPEVFNRALDGLAIGPEAGSCGTAAYQRRRVIVADIEASPLWSAYRELAAIADLRACWSEPILAGGEVIGTVALYFRTVREPSADELELLARSAQLAALAISRSRMETQLRNVLARRQQLFDDAPIGLALCRLDGALIEVNPAYAAMVGRSAEELSRLSHREITPERYAADEQAQLARVVATGQYGPYEKAYRHADGHLVPVRLRGRLLTQGGEPVIWSAVEDLTETRAAENEATMLAARLRAIAERMNEGLVLIDPGWHCVYANARAVELLGVAAGTSPAQLRRDVEGTLGRGVLSACDAAMANRSAAHREARLEGGERWLECRIHGSVDGISLFIADISERKGREIEIQAANARLQALSMRVLAVQEEERRRLARELHDQVGQSLTALKITMQSAASRVAEEGPRQQLANGVGIADDAIALVRSLSLDLRPAQLDDLGLVAALRWLAGRHATASGLDLQVDGEAAPENIPEAIAISAYRIVQEALTNILRHADARSVRIRVGEAGGMLLLEIRDDGRGFDAAALAAASGPRGLGIAGMRERAALVGGSLRLDSAPGAGCSVHAELPLHTIREEAP
jgi:PAS domain S-box-containing protein